jgi:hypothetical protein
MKIGCTLQDLANAVGDRVARWYIFKLKILIWVHFCRVLQWKMLLYFMDIWPILMPIGIFYGHLVYFSKFWNVVPRKIWRQPWSAKENEVGGQR